MRQLTVKKGTFEVPIIVDHHKIIVGNNYCAKQKLFHCIAEVAANIPASPYGKEIGNKAKIIIDGREISPKMINIFQISDNFSLFQELKLQAKSILLKALVNMLCSSDYAEDIGTVEGLLGDLCIQFNQEDYPIKLQNPAFNPSAFLKLIEPALVVDGEVMNEFDLQIEDYIKLQIDMITPCLTMDKSVNLVVIHQPVIKNSLLKKIKSIPNSIVLINTMLVQGDADPSDFYLMSESILDLASDEDIYEQICCDRLHCSDLKEAKAYMKNNIDHQIYTLTCPVKQK